MDTAAHKITYIKDKKEDYFLLFCKDPFKIKINYLKDPISISTSNFMFSDTDCIYENSGKLYLGGKNGITVVDTSLNVLSKIQDKRNSSVMLIAKWKDNLITIGDDRLLKLFNEKVYITITQHLIYLLG